MWSRDAEFTERRAGRLTAERRASGTLSRDGRDLARIVSYSD